MAAISIVDSAEIFGAHRWDAEAYAPALRRVEETLRDSLQLGSPDVASVSHPAEIIREYTDCADAVPFILAGNIKPVLPDLDELACIPRTVAHAIPSNRLQTGDILVTRTGANHGVACLYLGKTGAFYTSGEGLIVRVRGDIDSGYLAAFLGSKYGLLLCKKAAYGSGQPHIGPSYLRLLPVFRMSHDQETKVGSLIREAWTLQLQPMPLYRSAEAELLARLGWSKLEEKQPELFYVAQASELNDAKRFDAEFFQPQYKRLMKHLLATGARRLGDICEGSPHRGRQPLFSATGDTWVIDSKAVRPLELELTAEQRTDRALIEPHDFERSKVQEGDVLLNSTGRGTLGRAGCYLGEDLAVADNHVAIIRPSTSECLPLYLSLFLNAPPGLAQSEMFQTGSSGQLEIYPFQIRNMLVFLPANRNGKIDIEWQERLAAKVLAAREARRNAILKVAKAVEIVENAIESKLA